MTLDEAQAAHRAAVENHTALRAKGDAAETALSAAKSARGALLAAAGRGDPVKPGDMAAAAQAVASAETDRRSWSEAATIAANAERDAHRQMSLETQIEALSEYRKKCEGRAALADDVAAKIQAAREALAELERVDAQTAAAAPRHAITMGGQSPIASRILPPLDQPSTRGINNPPRRRDDVLAGVMRLPTGTDHLREIDREIARARETASLDAARRAAA